MTDPMNSGEGSMPDTTTPIQSIDTPAPAAEPAAPAAEPAAESPVAAAVAEAADFPQHYSLLFCSVALLIGATCLPIEGRWVDLYARQSISGGFLTIFAAYGVLAGWMNIHNRKMIVWPAFFAAADGLYIAAKRGMDLVNAVQKPDEMAFRDWVRVFGPGYYVIAICSLMVIWTLLTAAASGAKKEAARKEAAKAARQKK